MNHHHFTVDVQAEDRVEAYRILGRTLAAAARTEAHPIGVLLLGGRDQHLPTMLADRQAAQEAADLKAYNQWATAEDAKACRCRIADSFNVRISDLAKDCPIHGSDR